MNLAMTSGIEIRLSLRNVKKIRENCWVGLKKCMLDESIRRGKEPKDTTFDEQLANLFLHFEI